MEKKEKKKIEIRRLIDCMNRDDNFKNEGKK